jgi:DNA anti-recombination protein RmuC
MELMTSRWTDDRLDDLKHQVDDLGRRMDLGFAEVNRRMDEGFAEVNQRFDAMNARFDERLDSMQRTMIQFGGALIVALVGLTATQLGLILTQL